MKMESKKNYRHASRIILKRRRGILFSGSIIKKVKEKNRWIVSVKQQYRDCVHTKLIRGF